MISVKFDWIFLFNILVLKFIRLYIKNFDMIATKTFSNNLLTFEIIKLNKNLDNNYKKVNSECKKLNKLIYIEQKI